MKNLKQYVLALLIASFLAIGSLGIGVTVITNASGIMEDSDITATGEEYMLINIFKYYGDEQSDLYEYGEGLEDWEFKLYYKDGPGDGPWGDPIMTTTTNSDGEAWFWIHPEDFLIPQSTELGLDVNGPRQFHFKVEETLKQDWYFTGGTGYGGSLEEDGEEFDDEPEISVRMNWFDHVDLEFGNAMETLFEDEDWDLRLFKFHDIEATRGYSEGDYPIPDWRFGLYKGELGDLEFIGEFYTNETGRKIIPDILEPETQYFVKDYLPPGWYNTYTDQQAFEDWPTPGDAGAESFGLMEVENNEDWEYQIVSFTPRGDWIVTFGNSIDYGEIELFKFYDANYDGEYDEELEDLIGGFYFNLWNTTEEGQPNERIYGPVEATDGTYIFEDLEPGYYVVQELIPEIGEDECCWFSTTGDFVEDLGTLIGVEVEAGETSEVWFGNVRGGNITGMKFLSVDGNEYFEVGLDKPLMGWEINLHEANRPMVADIWQMGDYIDTTYTDRSGQYYFECLAPGYYFVREEIPEGWYNVTPQEQLVLVEPCTTTEDVDFANCMYKDIYGIKFYDRNATGEFNPEDGDEVIEGWTIRLLDEDLEEIVNTTTDHLGYYYFEGLTVGTYYVEEEELEDEGWATSTESRVRVDLNCCTPCTVVNFGNYERPEITIVKFEDTYMTGTYDELDDELLDVAVLFDVDREEELFVSDLSVIGEYTFYVDAFYNYTVTEQLPAGWHATTDLIQSTEHPLVPGENYIFYFGNVRYGNITVFKFHDVGVTGDYNMTDGDVPLARWNITLYNETMDLVDWGYTEEDGLITFEELLPGEYYVGEELWDCWMNTTELPVHVTLEAGDEKEVEIGNARYGMISGYKYCGYEDYVGEPIADWEIYLYVGEERIEETTTNETGYYEFTCLAPGTYTVTEESPEGWYHYSDAEVTVELELEMHYEVNFYNYRHADIWGLKFCDFNMNEEFEPGIDAPLCGWEIELYNITDGETETEPYRTTTTDNHGMYYFNDVAPGHYLVREIIKECGWTNTTPYEVSVHVTGCIEEIEVNFGNYRPSDITVYLFDLDENAPISGAEVELWEISEMGGQKVEIIDTGITGDHGYYVFCNLDPGYYLVEIYDGEYSQSVMLRCCGEWVEFVINGEELGNNDTPQATYAKIE